MTSPPIHMVNEMKGLRSLNSGIIREEIMLHGIGFNSSHDQ